eukprot:TRINITY_DN51133_c0_g1_i1.p1 TRINITY_DN51133_c0_g1~~TRINITY_DN51133_c0_g1_i1.p1  ORF type:complete len:213 (+),score=31.06 TRINITY_DN51133_c0_g1_i1:129-767(+)
MEDWLRENAAWIAAKAGGKGNASSKKRRISDVPDDDPYHELALDNAQSTLEIYRLLRQFAAGCTYTALSPCPPQECLLKAIDSTERATGIDPTRENVDTLIALSKGLASLESTDTRVSQAIAVVKQFVATASDIEAHVPLCRVVITHDKKNVKTTWWLRGWDSLNDAFRTILVSLGAHVEYGPAPKYKLERRLWSSYGRAKGVGKRSATSSR